MSSPNEDQEGTQFWMVPLEIQLFPAGPLPPSATNGLRIKTTTNNFREINLLPGPHSKEEAQINTDTLVMFNAKSDICVPHRYRL